MCTTCELVAAHHVKKREEANEFVTPLPVQKKAEKTKKGPKSKSDNAGQGAHTTPVCKHGDQTDPVGNKLGENLYKSITK